MQVHQLARRVSECSTGTPVRERVRGKEKGQHIWWKSGGHYEKGKVAAAKMPSLCMVVVAESKIPRTIKERQVGQCVCLPPS